jgi:hypothetical protein
MKHCNSCNLDYDDNFNFCRKCGAPLQNVSSGDNLTSGHEEGLANHVKENKSETDVNEYSNNTFSNEPRDNKNKKIGIAILMVIVVLIAGGIWYSSSSTSGATVSAGPDWHYMYNTKYGKLYFDANQIELYRDKSDDNLGTVARLKLKQEFNEGIDNHAMNNTIPKNSSYAYYYDWISLDKPNMIRHTQESYYSKDGKVNN